MTLSFVFTFFIFILSVSNNFVLGHRRHPHTTTTTTPRPRFPHLDRILNRLDEERYRSTPSPDVEWFNPHGNDQTGSWHQLQQTAWQYPELQSILAESTYGMLRDDWMLDEEDDSDEDDTRDFGKQRDEAAGSSALTRFKWHSLGSRQDVARTRNRHLASEKEFQAALQHAVRVLESGQCQLPRPKVVCVSDVYPHPSKTYIPRCTLLHQCGDDTGCCKYESEMCVAKTSHPVELPFFTSTVGSKPRSAGGAGGASVERLLFYNHTQCECQDREQRDNAGRHQAAALASAPAVPDQRYYLRLPKPRRSPEEDTNKGCKCPSEYSVRQLDNGTCVCDCFDRQRECLRFKKGKHSFSLADRNCVLTRECREPACEFGAYIPRAGRCPIKWEQYGMLYHETPSATETGHKTMIEHKPQEPHSKTALDIKPVTHWSESKSWTSDTNNKPILTPWASSSDSKPIHTPWTSGSDSKSSLSPWSSSSGTKPAVSPWSSSSDTKPAVSPWSSSSDTKPVVSPWSSSSDTKPVVSPWSSSSDTKPAVSPWSSSSDTKPAVSPWSSGSDTKPISQFPWNPSPIASSSQTKTWPEPPRSIPTSVQNKPRISSSSDTHKSLSWSPTNTDHKYPWLESKPVEHKYPWIDSQRATDQAKPSQQRQTPTEHKYPWQTPSRVTEQRPVSHGRLWGSTTESQPRFPWNPSDSSSRSKPSSAIWPSSRSSRDTRVHV